MAEPSDEDGVILALIERFEKQCLASITLSGLATIMMAG